jgi:hypothetical protein
LRFLSRATCRDNRPAFDFVIEGTGDDDKIGFVLADKLVRQPIVVR